MRQYFNHVKSKEPHERRQHAMRIAGAVTAAVFAVWITTLGLRLGGTQVAQDTGDQTSLTASVSQGTYTGPNALYVASTTGF
jgi:hypothetical protein